MRYAFTILSLLVATLAFAQANNTEAPQDNNEPRLEGEKVESVVITIPADTSVLVMPNGDKYIRSIGPHSMGHSPHTATMYAAILPGLGQIYNRKYWKLPILYGGIAALCYSIHFNNKYYKEYKNAYRDFVIGDPNNKSYVYIVEHRTSLTVEEVETTYRSWFQNALKNKKDYYRRYRDLSYFGLIGVYVLQIVDAAVDAHFFTFDVSDDLTLQWQPSLLPEESGKTGIGASLSFTF
ncbi:MAG: DUF5683 domain-containing protein [Bacteroidales bacterium]|nr:DUF5683 domain-containing protein [Bacteroidales bacterium]